MDIDEPADVAVLARLDGDAPLRGEPSARPPRDLPARHASLRPRLPPLLQQGRRVGRGRAHDRGVERHHRSVRRAGSFELRVHRRRPAAARRLRRTARPHRGDAPGQCALLLQQLRGRSHGGRTEPRGTRPPSAPRQHRRAARHQRRPARPRQLRRHHGLDGQFESSRPRAGGQHGARAAGAARPAAARSRAARRRDRPAPSHPAAPGGRSRRSRGRPRRARSDAVRRRASRGGPGAAGHRRRGRPDGGQHTRAGAAASAPATTCARPGAATSPSTRTGRCTPA